MSRSTKVSLSVAAATIFVFLAAPNGSSQEPPAGNQDTILTFVHDFLRTFYPETLATGNQLVLCISHPADASWREVSGVYFKVTPFSKEESNPLVELGQTPILLNGSFWLTPQRQYGRVFQMVASSEVVHEKQINAIRKLVESNPDWSESQAIQALKSMGARYGPAEKEEFVSSLHLEKAERFLGKLKIKRLDFNGINSVSSGALASSLFDWVVQADSKFPDGTQAQYGFTFEPFEGKLIYLSRR